MKEFKLDDVKVVTLIGSTRFRPYFEEVAEKLSLMGYLVLMPPIWDGPKGIELTENQEFNLESFGCWRMAKSNYTILLNINGYIGPSTLKELQYGYDNKISVGGVSPFDLHIITEDVEEGTVRDWFNMGSHDTPKFDYDEFHNIIMTCRDVVNKMDYKEDYEKWNQSEE